MFSINSIATKILSYVSALVIGFSAGYSYCNDHWKTKDYEAVVTSQKVEIQKLTDLNAHNENIVVTQNKKIQQGNHLARELQNEISKKDVNTLIEMLTNFTIPIDKVQSKEKAFVNAGGIDTKGIHPKTMESKDIPGLYFIGETIDVHGPIGGFNITIALSTGFKCGSSI